jgi:hypothetical protein
MRVGTSISWGEGLCGNVGLRVKFTTGIFVIVGGVKIINGWVGIEISLGGGCVHAAEWVSSHTALITERWLSCDLGSSLLTGPGGPPGVPAR